MIFWPYGISRWVYIHFLVHMVMLFSSVILPHRALCYFICLSKCAYFIFKYLSNYFGQGCLNRWPQWSFANPMWPSLFTLISLFAVVFSFTIISTENWLPFGIMAFNIVCAYYPSQMTQEPAYSSWTPRSSLQTSLPLLSS